ncbi:MAG: FHA domain-containing protein [Phycisphaerales bacterium]|nr:FHA domain-containing protein [Phycisphaerales bacterium]
MIDARGTSLEPGELTGGGPTLVLTAGAKSPGQKSWTISRPITLIGSKRPAHILLHQPAIQPAHCVVVMAGGRAILLDLLTPTGTRCNGDICVKRELRSGDVIEVGPTRINVAFSNSLAEGSKRRAATSASADVEANIPDASGMLLLEEPSGRSWRIHEPVALIGARSGVDVQLHGALVADVQAVLFRFGATFAIFDVSPRGGVLVNGWPARLGAVATGDRIQIGSSQLLVALDEGDPVRKPLPRAQAGQSQPEVVGTTPASGSHASARPAADRAASAPWREPLPAQMAGGDTPADPAFSRGCEPAAGCDQGELLRILAEVQARLEAIQPRLASSWQHLNDRRSSHALPARKGEDSGANLARRVAELDALDAALRGHLFDLTRTHEELDACRQELLTLAHRWLAADVASSSKTAAAATPPTDTCALTGAGD